MATARQLMTVGVDCVGEGETLVRAAELMRRLGVGALPICGDDDRLKGMLTDRDIVVKALGVGKDASRTTAGELAQGDVVYVEADDDAMMVLRRMTRHKVRRLPVIDDHRLVGMISQADVARALPEPQVGDLLEALSTE
ncbi:CBS domain-containing protein [Streptomyces sp. SP18CS02]|uniref:CBS domain-containing protein n=1 Tax=Streptomyces sp. SP18CS02 TaxID=3002531 RepID=UPI002E75FFAA|nr:CBS domain-containing protein [Streptomyces sp. SP18CS02]MEE1753214.1 CBS domain-containing protein [Streptomyces sp. SP18CS02]